MPAIVNEKNGAAETATDKTGGTVRMKNADDAVVDLNDPLVVPASGSEWSFQKWLRLQATGTFTQISNLVAYTDGGNGFGTGVNLWWRAAASYVQPAKETASTGYVDAFSYVAGAPLSLGVGPFTTPGDIGSYLVQAMEVLPTASQGQLTPETITFGWDEI